MELLIAVPAFALWYVFILNIISLSSGWWALARRYPAGSHFDGTRFHWRSAQLGWSNYGGCLTIGVSGEGLHLAVPLFWRPGHPPLFILWSEIDATFTKGWLFHYLDLRFRQVPHLRLRVGHALGLKIAAAANRSWGADDLTTNGPGA